MAFSWFSAERTTGLALVVAIHTAALWGLWSHRMIPLQDKVATLFVNILEPDRPPPKPPKPAQAERRLVEQVRQIVAETPKAPLVEPVAPPLPPAPAIAAPLAPPNPAGPVTLSGELSVSCPERTPPRYPPLSRRLGETGIAVLRVELDEQGRVARSVVATGSGHARLDEAALAAVHTWRCIPARRDGQTVRAVALQPFKFVLE